MHKKMLILLSCLLVLSSMLNGYLLLKESTHFVRNTAQTRIIAPVKNPLKVITKPDDLQQITNNATQPQLATVAGIKSQYLSANHVKQLVEQAEMFFSSNQFSQAVDHYEQVKERDELQASKLKNQWLIDAKQWINDQQFSQLALCLEAVLARQPYDQQWLLLKVQWLQKVNRLVDAISVYQDLIANAFDYEKEQYWQAQIRQLAKQQATLFKADKSWQKLLDFNLYLLANESDYPPYILSLSEAYIHLHKMNLAREYIESIRYESAYQDKIAALEQLINEEYDGKEGIALTKIEDHFLVEATINNQLEIQLLIDTGASITVISQAFYHYLESRTTLTNGREIVINTASGEEQTFSVIVEAFAIGSYQLDNFEMVVMDLPGFDKANGLLGMNFLKAFKFRIDQGKQRLMLSSQ